MSVNLDINDYDDYTYTFDSSNNIQMTSLEKVGYKKVDLSRNVSMFKKKAPLDILKE